jgi:hypothetical protein
MHKPHLIQGIFLACGLSAVAMLAMMAHWALPLPLTLQGLVALLAGGYILSLLVSQGARVGRITLGTLATGILLAATSLGLSATTMVLLAIGLIWLVRSLLYYASLLSAVLDGVLCAVSLGGALGAGLLSDSLVLAVWCFFLAQALWVCIPTSLARLGRPRATGQVETEPHSPPDAFARAYRAADEAIGVMARQEG